jgi:hypothetical protein
VTSTNPDIGRGFRSFSLDNSLSLSLMIGGGTQSIRLLEGSAVKRLLCISLAAALVGVAALGGFARSESAWSDPLTGPEARVLLGGSPAA